MEISFVPPPSDRPTQAEVAALADILANFHDWPTDDLLSETREIMANSFPERDPAWAVRIASEFLSASPSKAASPDFCHVQFVNQRIESITQ